MKNRGLKYYNHKSPVLSLESYVITLLQRIFRFFKLYFYFWLLLKQKVKLKVLGPECLWVADFTYISTWEGWCYTAFVTDVFARRILGWSCSTQMNQRLVTEAFKMAAFVRSLEGCSSFEDLIHHNDKGSQYTPDDFNNLLALYGIRTSIGSVGDSYDNALAETLIGAYKTELIGNKGPWLSEYNDWQTPFETEKTWYDNGVDARKSSINRESVTVH